MKSGFGHDEAKLIFYSKNACHYENHKVLYPWRFNYIHNFYYTWYVGKFGVEKFGEWANLNQLEGEILADELSVYLQLIINGSN